MVGILMNTHQKGYEAEALFSIEANKRGYVVSFPEVETRYDMILDDGEHLYRIQMKYVDHFIGEALNVDFRKQCRNNGVTKVYTANEVDAVVLYVPKTGKFYWIPPGVFDGKMSVKLRISPSKNGQIKRTRLLSDFEWVASFNGEAAVS